MQKVPRLDFNVVNKGSSIDEKVMSDTSSVQPLSSSSAEYNSQMSLQESSEHSGAA